MTETPLKRNLQFARTVAKPLGDSIRLNARATLHTRRLGHSGYAGAVITDYDPLDRATSSQPFEAYTRLHETGRVHYSPKRSTWILSRLEDVRDGLRDYESITSAEGVTRVKFSLPILVMTDGEEHSALRRQVLPAFTKAALESWRPMVDKIAEELVADLIANPGADVVQRLAIPMPMRLIAHILGVPDGDLDNFRRWSEATIQLLDFAPTPSGVAKTARAVNGIASLWRYFTEQFGAGKLKGSETVLGRLLEQNDVGTLNDRDLFFFALLLLMAGNETTTNLLGSTFDTLARQPDQFELIKAKPDLIPIAVEEQLRYSSPIQNLYRTARTDYRIENVTIPAGARILMSFGAANRDPSIFDAPNEYRADRNPKQHLAFGYGAHLCLGANLARMEAQAVLRELAAHVSEIDAVSDTSWTQNSSLRGPTHLQVRLRKA